MGIDVGVVALLISNLEHASGRRVDVVLLDEAQPGLAYRIVRDRSFFAARCLIGALLRVFG